MDQPPISTRMKSVTITIPHPPLPCRPNSRAGWQKKARAVKSYRLLAASAAQFKLLLSGFTPPKWKRARVRIVWRCQRNIHPDPDNIVASLKAAFDGLADAGVVENDKGLWPERPEVEVGHQWPEVVLTVEAEA